MLASAFVANAFLAFRQLTTAHEELAQLLPSARRAGGIDGVCFGLGCSTRLGPDQKSDFDERLHASRVRRPEAGVSGSVSACVRFRYDGCPRRST
jgi:hypothetical protein